MSDWVVSRYASLSCFHPEDVPMGWDAYATDVAGISLAAEAPSSAAVPVEGDPVVSSVLALPVEAFPGAFVAVDPLDPVPVEGTRRDGLFGAANPAPVVPVV